MLLRAGWSRALPYAVSLAWVAFFAVLQWSVVRFRVPIVVVLTLSALALAAWQWRRPAAPPATRRSISLALLGSAVALAWVPSFTYLDAGARRWALGAFIVGAVLAAVLVQRPGPSAGWLTLGAGVTAYLVGSVVAIVGDPAPRIDVWVTLQQASDGLLHGQNMYAMTWTGSPGIRDAFTYLPWTAVLLAPGRWLAGDVRWALVLWTLVACAGLLLLGRGALAGRRALWAAGPVVALLLLAPGTPTQVEQAWTEPLLLAGLVWWGVLVSRDRAWWAVIPLALACASKQHLVLLLPVLLVWRPFGWRRTLATGALTGLLIAPWFLASPADFVHDTVSLLVTFHPIRFANTLYLLALNAFGLTLPFWLPGLVVLGTLGAVVGVVRRRQPDLPELWRWLALVLLVANLVNKQAFYNQFWLVGALVAASLATRASTSSGRLAGKTVSAT
jgi:hypothetical protein